MKLQRNSLLVEPPSVATGDIAFILIVFFLVCASVQPDAGRPQEIPKSEEKKDKSQQSKNIEVALKRTIVTVNGDAMRIGQFSNRIKTLLAGKTRQEDKVVVVKAEDDVPYHHWILVTGLIEEVGGIITLQLEEEREVTVE